MKFFYRLEQKYSKYAIRNLIYYIVIMYAIGLAIMLFNPSIYWNYLCLNMEAVRHGQIWRLVTFMIWPPRVRTDAFTTIFFSVIALSFYYSIGQSLERVWGSFRFNIYFIMGVIGHILASLIGYVVFDQYWLLTTVYLNFSLFLAYAMIFPNETFLLFFVIPIKAKILAAAQCAVYIYMLITGGTATRCEIIVSLLNVLVFLILTQSGRFNFKQMQRKKKFQAQIKVVAPGQPRHRCAVCGRTEKDGADLEFRYCSRCEGSFEYCQDHLYTHIHVTKDSEPKNS